jgi:hypothetical protein
LKKPLSEKPAYPSKRVRHPTGAIENYQAVQLYTEQRSMDRGVTPPRPAAGGAIIFSGGAVAVHREIWRFPRLLAILSVSEE